MMQREELATMWVENSDSLRRLLISFTRDIDLAEDLLQETYIRAQQGFDGYAGRNSRAWLSAIARNAFYTHFRRKPYACERTQLDADPVEQGVEPGSDPHLDVLSLRDAVSKLTPSLRSALMLKHYAGFTYDEIASKSLCPVGTAKTRVRTALGKLRLSLGLSGTPDQAACPADRETVVVDYLYCGLEPTEQRVFENHLAECARCRMVVEELRATMCALDMIEGDQKMMHIVEVDRRGAAKLYLTFSRTNESGQPQETTAFYTGRKARMLHWIAQGQELAYRQWSDPDQPMHVHYQAQLPVEALPGQMVEELAVFRVHPDEARAKALDAGGCRFEWSQRPDMLCDVAYVQAVRIPENATLAAAYPEPREVRVRDSHTTVLWVSLLAPNEGFKCSVDYFFADA